MDIPLSSESSWGSSHSANTHTDIIHRDNSAFQNFLSSCKNKISHIVKTCLTLRAVNITAKYESYKISLQCKINESLVVQQIGKVKQYAEERFETIKSYIARDAIDHKLAIFKDNSKNITDTIAKILAIIIIAIPISAASSTFFFFGGVFAFFGKEKSREVITDITTCWNKSHIVAKVILVLVLLFQWPGAIPLIAFLCGAKAAHYLQDKAGVGHKPLGSINILSEKADINIKKEFNTSIVVGDALPDKEV